jgi:PKD repeat protein
MKKLLTLFVILLTVTFSLTAQTITVHLSGTVLRDSTYLPVPNHEVVIQADSNANGFYIVETRYTNANGFYDCTINNVPTTGTAVSFTVRTQNCDSTWMYQSFIGTITPDTVNFLICNGNNAGCQAAFQSYNDSATQGLVFFNDYSTPQGSIVAWHWDFGDGSPGSISQNPVHIYPAMGTYTACLTIETSNSCSSVVCHDVTVGQNTGCQAHYNFYADSVNALLIHFWDTSTPLNMITSRLWNFGDPASGINNTSTTMDPWHTYSQAGVYLVCLTINTSNACTSTFCDSIFVGSNPTNCENWMTYTNTGFTYTFEGHTHSIFPTVYTWEMGDGSATLTGQVVTHTYAAPGTYTVTLHSVDSIGCEWNRTQSVNVETTTFDLYGYVYLSNQLYVDHGLAELLRADSGVITVVASQEFGDSLGMYWFGGVLPGHYYIRATLLPTSAYFGQYVPTYYIDAVNWGSATLIELGQPANPYNIHMHHVNGYTSGNGNINGTINQNGKYSDNGTPAADVEVLLMDESNQVLAFTMTNSSGEFSFENMAFGTYKVYPEMIEKNTTPTTVILDETHTGVNVVFTIEGGNISGIHDATAQPEFTVSDVYPNPVSEIANLNIQTLRSTGITAGIYSITGEFVKEINCTLHSGANKIVIPVAGLRKGLYYIKIEKPQGGVVVKKFISGR